MVGAVGAGVVGAGGGFAAGALIEDDAVSATPKALTIGSILPLSGSLGPDAILLRNGMTLAITQANDAGGVCGRQVQHLVVDADVTNDDSVGAAAAELVTKRVHAAVNGFLIAWRSGYTNWHAYGAPYLHVSSSEPQRAFVASSRTPLPFFQATPTETQYGAGLINLLNRHAGTASGPRAIQFLTREIPHTRAIEAGARAAARSPGRLTWQLLPTLQLAEPVTDWTSRMQTIRSRHPAATVINTPDPAEASAFLAAAQHAKLPGLLYYPGPADGFTSDVGDGVLSARVAARYDDEAGADFVTQYTKQFGHAPDLSYASAGYDAVKTLLAAWGQSTPERFAAVCAVLRSQTWRGVQGCINFAAPGQTARSYPGQTSDPSLGQALLVYQRRGGKDVVIDPQPYAAARIDLG